MTFLKTFKYCQIIHKNYNTMKGLPLNTVVSKLNEFANPEMAESWDNVGLLLKPSKPLTVEKIFLTNDLTEEVMDEALEVNANMIISYHPPIFSALKRLSENHWKQTIVTKCIENRVALYSPHTAWDLVEGGVTDWLIHAFEDNFSGPIDPINRPTNEFEKNKGSGRVVNVHKLKIIDAVNLLKKHIDIPTVRLALGKGKTLDSPVDLIAVVPGSGRSVMKYCRADLQVTGEMSHHEILETVHNECSVILTDHSNCERGFLKVIKENLNKTFENNIEIHISNQDRDPVIHI